MLLLLTASAMYSPQVRREVERAVHKEIPVIALRLDHEPLSKSLEYFLSAQHWIAAGDRAHEAHRPAVIGALAAAFRVDGRLRAVAARARRWSKSPVPRKAFRTPGRMASGATVANGDSARNVCWPSRCGARRACVTTCQGRG